MNPYKRQASRAFWSRSVASPPGGEVDPMHDPSFAITPTTKVATAGSCFAQNIAKHLKRAGIMPLVTEAPHPITTAQADAFGYNLYTARYGNIYTSRQMLQLFRRAYGQLTPSEEPWKKGDVWVDPFRPLINCGYATQRELERDREQHLAAVRTMFETFDVLVFTLGLTEAWVSRADGIVFPSCPGTIAGEWDDDRYAFVNFRIGEVVEDLKALVSSVRAINPEAKLLLTVSPVPLVATATPGHVLPATVYSKSVLRVAAQTATDALSGVDYFPSYEMVTGPQAGAAMFEADCRTVTESGVEAVMKVFSRHYLAGASEPLAAAPPRDEATAAAALATDLVCDEMYNDTELAQSSVGG